MQHNSNLIGILKSIIKLFCNSAHTEHCYHPRTNRIENNSIDKKNVQLTPQFITAGPVAHQPIWQSAIVFFLLHLICIVVGCVSLPSWIVIGHPNHVYTYIRIWRVKFYTQELEIKQTNRIQNTQKTKTKSTTRKECCVPSRRTGGRTSTKAKYVFGIGMYYVSGVCACLLPVWFQCLDTPVSHNQVHRNPFSVYAIHTHNQSH